MIQLEGVWKVYKLQATEVIALKDIDLVVGEGEKIAVMGPSGSGKSTLLHLIGALDKPTRGIIMVDGVNLSEIPERKLSLFRRKNIGFVFQFYYLVPTLTALENVMLPLLPLNPPWLEEKARQLLKEVGLEHRITHRPSELSGGEQQRVAIARALINDPKIILADEPTGNLDTETGKRIVELLIDLCEKKGKTLIVATHDRKIAEMLERTIYLRDGKIVDGDEL